MISVLDQAQKLAQTILESEEYQAVHAAEQAVMKDKDAAEKIAAYMEKRQKVEAILADNNLDHSALALAGGELESAEQAMNGLELVQAMQKARAEFSQMMQNVNQIIRFVVTGETGEEESGCTGSCQGCGGCH